MFLIVLRKNKYSERCHIANLKLTAKGESILQQKKINETIIQLVLILISVLLFGFLYFKKNISKEKIHMKKFVLSALAMSLVAIIPFFVYGSSIPLQDIAKRQCI